MFKSPRYNKNYRILDVKALKEWSTEVRTALQTKPDGPHSLVLKIFGPQVADTLASRGHFGAHKQQVARAASTQSLLAGPSQIRSSSVRSRDSDWDSDEETIAPQSQRRRLN